MNIRSPMQDAITTRHGQTMGGRWSLRQPRHDTDGHSVVQAILDLVEAQMSLWRPASPICWLNAAPVGQWVDLPGELAFVIGAGLDLMRQVPGDFSILMGGVAAAGGFQPGPARQGSADPADLELNGSRARRRADIGVDVNALAKGFAADLAAHGLAERGCRNFLFEVAGDIAARGQRPDGLPWTVAMELPVPGRSIPARLIPVLAGGIATSGGYRRARGCASHLIRADTGQALPATAASVAVCAPSAMEAEGWSTALAVMGPARGLAFAASRGLACTFIEPDPPSGFRESGSPAMAALLDGGPSPARR